tara:strand:- start:4389 stop:7757 length:3369 start_codon:yes stop_codon:yes gene_type:complete
MPTFRPKRRFILSGSNMNFTEKVRFGTDEVEELAYVGTTGISGVVPANAITSDIFIDTSYSDTLNLGSAQVVLDSASQITVSGLEDDYVSGSQGDLITLSGQNFYRITDVEFGGVKSNYFDVLSEEEITVQVPQNANYGEVSVVSSLRTGLNGSTSEASGKSYNEFVPIPEVTGLSSGQLTSGEVLTIEGTSLSGVIGASINSISLTGYLGDSSLDGPNSTGLQFLVPVGNAAGSPVLSLKSGISYSAPSDISFTPLAKVTGVETNVEVGDFIDISGENFHADLLYDGENYPIPDATYKYLVSIGGETGNAKLVSDRVLRAKVPADVVINISGNLAAGGTAYFISTKEVKIFSQNYPEEYYPVETFTPKVGTPQITGLSPHSGVPGDLISIQGTNLYGMTGVDVGNIGFGTMAPIITTVNPGKVLQFELPSSNSYSNSQEVKSISLSGIFGDASTDFTILGTPVINSIYPVGFPDSPFSPGTTGAIYGSNLYSGTTLSLHDGNVAPANFRGDIGISGYTLANNQITFTYPAVLETGNDYKIRARNRRGTTLTSELTGFMFNPVISGFEPSEAEFGDTVTVSGYFEEIVTSGLKIGEYFVDDYTQDAVNRETDPHKNLTGFVFTIPENITSDVINIQTSGGLASSTGILKVSQPKPSISGFYLGQGGKPSSFNQDQVFQVGDIITVTGERMNLITGFSFTGENGSEFSYSDISFKNPSRVVFNVPPNIHTGSGVFKSVDFKNRKSDTPFGINVSDISGFTNYLGKGETFTLSGRNVADLSVGFEYPTGGYVFTQKTTNLSPSGPDLGVETITVEVPTGITAGDIIITGEDNTNAGVSVSGFNPLSIISGLTGAGAAANIGTGHTVLITGTNYYNAGFESGDYAIGISGTGNYESRDEVYLYPVNSITTGRGVIEDLNIFYNKFSFQLDSGFIGTGKFFIVNPWDDTEQNSRPTSAGTETQKYLPNQVSFFPTEYKIEGTQVNGTGFGPVRGVTGSNVEITGFGFNAVTGVFFEIPSGETLRADFTINSATKITATVPKEGIESRGMTNILLSGGTNDSLSDFEVILDASVVEFNIVDADDTPVSSTRVGNFTQRETVNGVVYLVTRTRFPDGTTAVVSSTPEL